MNVNNIWYWVHNESPPLANLILTAGTHCVITFACGLLGWADRAAFAYIFKEGGPLVTAVFQKDRLAYLKRKYTPSPQQVQRGWTTAWVVADSVADVLGPCLVWFFMGG